MLSVGAAWGLKRNSKKSLLVLLFFASFAIFEALCVTVANPELQKIANGVGHWRLEAWAGPVASVVQPLVQLSVQGLLLEGLGCASGLCSTTLRTSLNSRVAPGESGLGL